MTEPDFWDDNIAAQKTSQELNELKQTYENFHQMTDLFDESEILLDFLAEDDSVQEELEEKLELDTNTLLSISSGDRAVCMLAARINAQLRGLRKERLRLQNGDAELKTAITNISHDLRIPLTAICGYLDLLEQENHTENSRRYLAVIRERTDAMNIF